MASLRSLAAGVAVIGRAERMVAQNLDDAAIGDTPARALHHHSFEFGSKRRQPRKAAFDFGQLRRCDGICCIAWLVWPIRQAEEVSDRFERETQISRMPDERQSFQCLLLVKPLVAGTALGLWQEPDLLIVADGRHLHSGPCTQLSNGQHQILLEAIVARDIRYPVR